MKKLLELAEDSEGISGLTQDFLGWWTGYDHDAVRAVALPGWIVDSYEAMYLEMIQLRRGFFGGTTPDSPNRIAELEAALRSEQSRALYWENKAKAPRAKKEPADTRPTFYCDNGWED